VADPQERFDRAYTFPYRLVRDPPRWHPDLVAASERRNLLGALAAGGPFAKLLQRAGAQSPEYLIDLQHFANYEVHDGLCRLGSRIWYSAPDGHLAVTGVEYEGETITPDSPRWDFAERIALAGLMTHVTVWRQGMEYHVGGLAPVPVLTHNLLPPAHPLRRLLAPHLNQTMTTNYHTHLTLRRSGFDVTGFTFPQRTILRYYDEGAGVVRYQPAGRGAGCETPRHPRLARLPLPAAGDAVLPLDRRLRPPVPQATTTRRRSAAGRP
jgi:arachidonate 15-lipoxygenase